MFSNYKIDVDKKDFERRIKDFGLSIKTVNKRMLSKVSSEIRRDSRRRERSQGKRTGELAQSIGYRANDDFTGRIYARKFYASFIENGVPLIQPKNGAYLTFMIDREWKKVKSVTIAAEPFLKPVIDDYFGSKKAEDIMDKVLQDAIDKKFQKD
jgi:hypothetical protein